MRGRLVTGIVHWGVKRWPRNDPAKLARRARQVFDLPNVLGFVLSRGLKMERIDAGPVRGEWISTRTSGSTDRVLLYLHGGGYVSCSPKSHRPITATLARLLPGRVFSLDYRLAPEHPFPAAVDDAAAACAWLLNQGFLSHQIAIAGDSAGAGLAVATLLRLRNSGQALPACAVCFSPWVDLTGASKYMNSASASASSSVFQGDDIAALAAIYLREAAPDHPEASPVFADLHGLPPFLIQAARTELLADDANRLHARATECGVSSTLALYPDLPHVWQIYGGFLPEARLALRQAAAFVTEKWQEAAHDSGKSNRPELALLPEAKY